MALSDLLRSNPEIRVDVPLDDLFETLSNSRRRQVIQRLAIRGGSSLSDIAEEIACFENGVETPNQLNSKQRKRVYIGLYQCHCGKLRDAGVIEWDDRSGDIEPGPRFEDYRQVLDVVGNGEPSHLPAKSGTSGDFGGVE